MKVILSRYNYNLNLIKNRIIIHLVSLHTKVTVGPNRYYDWTRPIPQVVIIELTLIKYTNCRTPAQVKVDWYCPQFWKRGKSSCLPKPSFKTSPGSTFSKKTHLIALCHHKQHFVSLVTPSKLFQIVSHLTELFRSGSRSQTVC